MSGSQQEVWFVTESRPIGFRAMPVHRNGWLVIIGFVIAALFVTAISIALVVKTRQVAQVGIVLLAMPFLAIGLVVLVQSRSMPKQQYLELKARK